MIHVLKYTITITIIIIIVRAVILEPDFVPRCSQLVEKKRDRRFSFLNVRCEKRDTPRAMAKRFSKVYIARILSKEKRERDRQNRTHVWEYKWNEKVNIGRACVFVRLRSLLAIGPGRDKRKPFRIPEKIERKKKQQEKDYQKKDEIYTHCPPTPTPFWCRGRDFFLFARFFPFFPPPFFYLVFNYCVHPYVNEIYVEIFFHVIFFSWQYKLVERKKC